MQKKTDFQSVITDHNHFDLGGLARAYCIESEKKNPALFVSYTYFC